MTFGIMRRLCRERRGSTLLTCGRAAERRSDDRRSGAPGVSWRPGAGGRRGGDLDRRSAPSSRARKSGRRCVGALLKRPSVSLTSSKRPLVSWNGSRGARLRSRRPRGGERTRPVNGLQLPAPGSRVPCRLSRWELVPDAPRTVITTFELEAGRPWRRVFFPRPLVPPEENKASFLPRVRAGGDWDPTRALEDGDRHLRGGSGTRHRRCGLPGRVAVGAQRRARGRTGCCVMQRSVRSRPGTSTLRASRSRPIPGPSGRPGEAGHAPLQPRRRDRDGLRFHGHPEGARYLRVQPGWPRALQGQHLPRHRRTPAIQLAHRAAPYAQYGADNLPYTAPPPDHRGGLPHLGGRRTAREPLCVRLDVLRPGLLRAPRDRDPPRFDARLGLGIHTHERW